MEIKFIHFLGPILATVAFFTFGRGMVMREKGKRFRPGPSLLLILAALSFRILFGEGDFLDRLSMTFLDIGIGLTVDAGYLAYKRVYPKVFWVPGVFALILSLGLYTFSQLIDDWFNKRKELLVELGPDDTIDEIKYILDEFDAEYEPVFTNVDLNENEDLAQYFAVYVDEEQADELLDALGQDKENVDHAELNQPVQLDEPLESPEIPALSSGFLADDPMVAEQWYAEAMQLNKVHEMLKGVSPNKKAIVAIVDTGVDEGHEDISKVFKKSKGTGDDHGHGTHCAGLAGAATNNGTGIASLNWEGKFISVTSYKGLPFRGGGSNKTIAQAIVDAAEDGADVISLSLGGHSPKPPKVMVDAVKYALSLGAVVVAAAGNDAGNGKLKSPANIEGVITVSALDQNLDRAWFSNTNTDLKMPIAAPGVDILSLIPGSEYKQMSGTSMATPLVSGLIGIIRSINPSLSAKEIYNLLHDTGAELKDSPKTGRMVQPAVAIGKAAGA